MEQQQGAREWEKGGEGKAAAQPSYISEMKPVTREAYGGGLYGTDDEGEAERKPEGPRASDTQSADGPLEPAPPPKHEPPPSTGDRDVDITGQAYIQ
ncbi:leukocyte receptor cluster member 8 [Cocos nucifera]|uniref:Leukocyte receptor cluster member 8 n=1 Tax=Cocos nucifera TaxID=13894 RepID=A0A8K0IH23_COCNU|nr:leukocyte receptor cluster member 8 [Cocos nucifera]